MIISFGVAAVGGIVVLLGDIWSETAGQVLGTTALTGIISVAVFCGATLISRPGQWFGIVTIVVAVCTLALLLATIWAESLFEVIDWNWIATTCLLTACAAVSSLILLLVRHESWTVRIALALTLGLMALSAVLTLVLIWMEDAFEVDWLYRLAGIVWILTALGVVVVPVSSMLLKRSPARTVSAPQTSSPSVSGAETVSGAEPVPGAEAASGAGPATSPAQAVESALSSTSLKRIDSAARAAGVTPDELIDRLLNLGRPER